jgi:phosphoribosylglycinamide formyltransferase-1
MKIGVFAYNFEHKKTQEGLLHLFLNVISIECVFAAEPVKLDFYQSKLRVSPKGLKYLHPSDIAKKLNVPYYVVKHNSDECLSLIRNYDLDLGIILGARIINHKIISSFRIGILNMHPGLLPQNRGLDNQKWAILKKIKQGVTTHLIDKFVDKGDIIFRKEIDVYEDDSLLDIFLRIQNMELELMVSSIRALSLGFNNFEHVESDESFKSVPYDKELELIRKFEDYKKNYAKL